MSGVSRAGASLPAAITSPTAWAAFKHVFEASFWSLQFPPDGSDHLDFRHHEAFSEMLHGVNARGYAEQARAIIGMRLIELASRISPYVIRQRRKQGDAEALEQIRRQIKNQIRDELTAHFDIEVWQQAVTADMGEILNSVPHAVEYLGLDQNVSPRTLDKAIKYVFQRCDPRIEEIAGAMEVRGNYKLDDIRGSDEDHDRAVAWKLVVKFLDATIRNTDASWLNRQDSASIVGLLHSRVRDISTTEGAWGLVHATLQDRRASLGLDLPQALQGRILELMEMQEQRLSPAPGLELQKLAA